MQKKNDRIIIDTNIWISFLLTNDYSKLDKILDSGVTLLFDEVLLEEFIEVAQRPKFKKYFSDSDLEKLYSQILKEGEIIKVSSVISICRDPKDDFLLALAKDGKATHLITGDKDLLEIKVYRKTKIVTISEYMAQDTF